MISGNASGVSTLADGSYSIAVAPGTILSYHYIGYKVVEFTVPDGNAWITHNVELQPEAQALDDVVVIAYGVRKREPSPDPYPPSRPKKVESTPTAAFDQALQGQVPGLTVLSSSGEPSVAATMNIRGTNSINPGRLLYILDGIAISSGDFNAINPADIESISVLKDASSTSIYGAWAANGVIVITTKRGRMAEKPNITYRMQLGFSQLAKGNWDLMNTAERIQYEKEIGLSTGKDYNRLSQIDVCWLDEVYNNSALLQNYELSVSGANEKDELFRLRRLYSQDGVAVGSYFDRYSIRANIEQRAAKWLKIGTNTMLNYQNIEQADDGEYRLVTPISAARFMLPYWNPYRPDGSLASVNDGSWLGDGLNPSNGSKTTAANTRNTNSSSLFAEATIIDGLTFKSQFNVDYTHHDRVRLLHPELCPQPRRRKRPAHVHRRPHALGHQYPELPVPRKRQARLQLPPRPGGPRLPLRGLLDPHRRPEQRQTRQYLLRYPHLVVARHHRQRLCLPLVLRAWRVQLRRPLLCRLPIRADASSRFGANRRWAGFWSLGFMWNLRNEGFMGARRWLTNAQIAVSTGTPGNLLRTEQLHVTWPLVSGGLRLLRAMPVWPQPASQRGPRVGEVWTTNLAFHLGFWRNRLNVDLELYNKRTTDMLMQVPQSYAYKGYGYYWDNIGVMVNRGAEINLSGTVVATKGLHGRSTQTSPTTKTRSSSLYNGVQEYEMAATSMKPSSDTTRRVLRVPLRRREPRQRRRPLVHQGREITTTECATKTRSSSGKHERPLGRRLADDPRLEGNLPLGAVLLGRRPLDDEQRPLLRRIERPVQHLQSVADCSTAGTAR